MKRHPILDHQLWSQIRPYVKIRFWSPDVSRGRPGNVNLIKDIPKTLRAEMVKLTCECPTCHNQFRAIRGSGGRTTGSLSIYASCHRGANDQCNYSVRGVLQTVIADVMGWDKSPESPTVRDTDSIH